MTVLETKGLSKYFPGVCALQNVDFSLEKGEVHALCGANGAGKSTIIKIIAGIQTADNGTMEINGKQVSIANPKQAYEAGIGTIFQDFELAQNLTVAENISLGRIPIKGGIVDWRGMFKHAESMLKNLQIDIDPHAQADTLGIGEQQMIEIARVVSQDIHILIMDEPTSSLSNEEVDTLFRLIANLKEQGVSIIYVSHRMEEVFQITDRITVMRDGQIVQTSNTKDITAKEIISQMIGDQEHTVTYIEKNCPDCNVLEVRDLAGPALKMPVSFNLRQQEILGIAGLMGAGRTEILCSIYGLGGDVRGNLNLEGEEFKPQKPSDAISKGIALIPEDRHNAGLFPNLSVGDNIVISCLAAIKSGLTINRKKEHELVEKNVRLFKVKTASSKTLINTLSGGNQQKVIFSKWLATKKKILLLDEPTRGIDVGAKAEIYSLTNDLVKDGLSVIIVSSELKELLDICDRILVLREGSIVGNISRDNFDYESITAMMMGA